MANHLPCIANRKTKKGAESMVQSFRNHLTKWENIIFNYMATLEGRMQEGSWRQLSITYLENTFKLQMLPDFSTIYAVFMEEAPSLVEAHTMQSEGNRSLRGITKIAWASLIKRLGNQVHIPIHRTIVN